MHVLFNGGTIKAPPLARAHRTLYANASIDDGTPTMPEVWVRRMDVDGPDYQQRL